MSKSISRRRALATGAATAGLALGATKQQAQANYLPDVWGSDFMHQWSPPDNIERDLTTGSSHVRLSCAGYRLRKPRDKGYAEQVKAVRDAGYTAVESGGGGWDITDSEIRELQAALKQHDVEFYTLHTWINIIHPDPEKRREAQKHVAQAVEAADLLGLKFILTHTGGRSPEIKIARTRSTGHVRHGRCRSPRRSRF